MDVPYEIGTCWYELGKMHLEKEDKTAARNCFTKAREYFEKIGSKFYLEKVNKELKEIEKK